MTALRSIVACLAVAFTVLLVSLGGQALASPSPMVDKVNAVRHAHGLPALRYSRSLSRSSARYARYLVRHRQFRHAARIRASNRFSALGEILARARGSGLDREQTIDDWLASPPHRAVLLSRSFRCVGAGRAGGRFAETVMWAVQFGRY